MINIIGNIKIDEDTPDRVQYFFATLLSFRFIPEVNISLVLTTPSRRLQDKYSKFTDENFKNTFTIISTNPDSQYKQGLDWLFNEAIVYPEYYLNFEEDHFCVMDSVDDLLNIVNECKDNNVDVLRTSYHDIETESAKLINKQGHFIDAFRMDQSNYQLFQHAYTRYYLGTNAMFKIDYAKKLYDRPGTRPHDFELSKYDPRFEYTCAIPKKEILRSIDNDHGGTVPCLLKQPTEKFLRCMEEAKKYM